MERCRLCHEKNKISNANLARYDRRCNICLAEIARNRYKKSKRVRPKIDEGLIDAYKKSAKQLRLPVWYVMALDLQFLIEYLGVKDIKR